MSHVALCLFPALSQNSPSKFTVEPTLNDLPLWGEVILWVTLTSTEEVEVLPPASVAVIVIVYTLPSPDPDRSARSLTFWLLITSQSGAASPSPVPLIGSSLLTDKIELIVPPQLSVNE